MNCDLNCESCKLPARKCNGGGKNRKSPYTNHECRPLHKGSGQSQPLRITSSNKINGHVMAGDKN